MQAEPKLCIVCDSALSATALAALAMSLIQPLVLRLQQKHLDRPLAVGMVTYTTPTTRPAIITRRAFCKAASLFPLFKAAPHLLGIGTTGLGAPVGMAMLEGLVAAIEMCDDTLESPARKQRILHPIVAQRPPRLPPSFHILLIGSSKIDLTRRPLCNHSSTLDDITWETLPEELSKRNITLSLCISPQQKEIKNHPIFALHNKLWPTPDPIWFDHKIKGYTLLFSGTHMPGATNTTKRPLDQPMPGATPKRIKGDSPKPAPRPGPGRIDLPAPTFPPAQLPPQPQPQAQPSPTAPAPVVVPPAAPAPTPPQPPSIPIPAPPTVPVPQPPAPAQSHAPVQTSPPPPQPPTQSSPPPPPSAQPAQPQPVNPPGQLMQQMLHLYRQILNSLRSPATPAEQVAKLNGTGFRLDSNGQLIGGAGVIFDARGEPGPGVALPPKVHVMAYTRAKEANLKGMTLTAAQKQIQAHMAPQVAMAGPSGIGGSTPPVAHTSPPNHPSPSHVNQSPNRMHAQIPGSGLAQPTGTPQPPSVTPQQVFNGTPKLANRTPNMANMTPQQPGMTPHSQSAVGTPQHIIPTPQPQVAPTPQPSVAPTPQHIVSTPQHMATPQHTVNTPQLPHATPLQQSPQHGNVGTPQNPNVSMSGGMNDSQNSNASFPQNANSNVPQNPNSNPPHNLNAPQNPNPPASQPQNPATPQTWHGGIVYQLRQRDDQAPASLHFHAMAAGGPGHNIETNRWPSELRITTGFKALSRAAATQLYSSPLPFGQIVIDQEHVTADMQKHAVFYKVITAGYSIFYEFPPDPSNPIPPSASPGYQRGILFFSTPNAPTRILFKVFFERLCPPQLFQGGQPAGPALMVGNAANANASANASANSSMNTNTGPGVAGAANGAGAVSAPGGPPALVSAGVPSTGTGPPGGGLPGAGSGGPPNLGANTMFPAQNFNPSVPGPGTNVIPGAGMIPGAGPSARPNPTPTPPSVGNNPAMGVNPAMMQGLNPGGIPGLAPSALMPGLAGVNVQGLGVPNAPGIGGGVPGLNPGNVPGLNPANVQAMNHRNALQQMALARLGLTPAQVASATPQQKAAIAQRINQMMAQLVQQRQQQAIAAANGMGIGMPAGVGRPPGMQGAAAQPGFEQLQAYMRQQQQRQGGQ